MVSQLSHDSLPSSDPIELPEEDLRWSSVSISEAVGNQLRLKAAVFDIEGRHAHELVEDCKWPLTNVAGDKGLAKAFYPGRFKRLWVENSDYPIYQPGQINDLNPKPSGFISEITQVNFDDLRVSEGQILMTRSGRSGSIGRTTCVSKTLDGRIFSDDLIRLTCHAPDTVGYLYAFLSTKTGRALVKTNEYGAMIPHIEPFHLESVPVPDPQPILRKQIHDLVMESFRLRDEANALFEEAQTLLLDTLKMPSVTQLRSQILDDKDDLRSSSVNLSNLSGRLDAEYHKPIVSLIIKKMKTNSAEITNISDARISKQVVLPGRFKRVYVEEGQGIPFFGGKQIHQLDPTDRKFLSLKIHGDRIKQQLTIEEHMTLITCSGTIGKVAFAPKHWKGLAASQHVIRVVPSSEDIAGYLYVFLATDHGKELIDRFTYGAAVGEINAEHVSNVQIPLLKDKQTQTRINSLALAASKKLSEAYHDEQKAIRITNEKVIHAQ